MTIVERLEHAGVRLVRFECMCGATAFTAASLARSGEVKTCANPRASASPGRAAAPAKAPA